MLGGVGLHARAGTALRSLKGPREVELSASFYAGVLRKIEEKKNSSSLVQPGGLPDQRPLGICGFTVAVILGSYVVGHEARDGHLEATTIMARNIHYDPAVYGDQDQQRNAVLTNFADPLSSSQGNPISSFATTRPRP